MLINSFEIGEGPVAAALRGGNSSPGLKTAAKRTMNSSMGNITGRRSVALKPDAAAETLTNLNLQQQEAMKTAESYQLLA